MAVIAFIGLGNMGLPMATNLLRAGHRIVAYDLSPLRRESAGNAGATVAENVRSAVENADVVVTMVFGGDNVKRLYLSDGVIAHSKAGTLLIDCSTIDMAASRSVQHATAAANLDMVDAPVSGGTHRAADGTLTIMVGGSDQAFQRASPILSAMGNAVYHMGESGMGLAAKVCNNLVTGITLAAVSEAFALGQRLHLDPQKLFDVMTRSSAKSWVLDVLCPVPGPVPTAPSNFGFKPGGAASLLVKDLGLAQKAALEAGSPSPMGSAALSLYTMFCNAGYAEMDASAIIKLFENGAAAMQPTVKDAR